MPYLPGRGPGPATLPWAAATLALALTACGGGGGSSPAAILPAITAQPQSQTVTAPTPATFSVTATGSPAPTYQWNLAGTAIPGAVSASYTTPATTSAMNGASYTVTVTNSAGSVTSSPPAILTVATTGPTALNFTALPQGAFSYSQGSYIESFEFRANAALTITQLGYYDSNLAGTGETFNATPVGVYDMTTGVLLGSATVQASDPATTIFRYATLATPIPLNTTDTYAAVAVTGSNYYVSGFNYDGQVNPALTWVGFAGYGGDNLTQTSVLVLPDFFWTGTGNIGANFMFEQN